MEAYLRCKSIIIIIYTSLAYVSFTLQATKGQSYVNRPSHSTAFKPVYRRQTDVSDDIHTVRNIWA